MVFLLIGLGALSAVVCHGTVLFVPAVVAAVAAFWSTGVLVNFRNDPERAPDFAAFVSMLAALTSVIFLIWGWIIR